MRKPSLGETMKANAGLRNQPELGPPQQTRVKDVKAVMSDTASGHQSVNLQTIKIFEHIPPHLSGCTVTEIFHFINRLTQAFA